VASLNPITCTACQAQFAVPDDLFKRRVSGRKVIVRCRNCGAHITVDATDSAPPSRGEPPAAQSVPTDTPPDARAPALALSESRTPATTPSKDLNVPPAVPPRDESPARMAPEQPKPARAVTAPGVVPRLSGPKAKLPPVVPRAVIAPQAVRPSLRAPAKSDAESSGPDSAVAVTAAKPASPLRARTKHLPPRPGPSKARAADVRSPDASAPEPTPASSTRLAQRPAAPIQDARRHGAPPATVQTAPVAPKAVDQPIAKQDDEDRPTVPAFDTEEAPTHPLGADVSDSPPSAPSPPPRSTEPALAEAVVAAAAQDTTGDEAPPSSARQRMQPDERVDGVTYEYASDPFAPSPGAAPAPLEPATSPDALAADTPAAPLQAPNRLAQPPRSARRARWVIAVAVLATALLSAAVFIWWSAHRASGSTSARHESKPAVSNARRASTDSQGPAVAPGVASAARPASAASAPAAPEKPAEKATSGPEPASTASVAQPASDMPGGLDREIVLQRVRSVLATAAHCHEGGRATGTATVVLTFDGKGRVSDARIEGEPIASAPVAGCILTYARSILIPKFSGSPFTLREPITLR
jgi:hypothetical protein